MDNKHIEKIRELKRENMKLKKYKTFVQKSKDSKEIYNEMKDLQNEVNKYQACKKHSEHLLYENKMLQAQVLKLEQSELSFANKSNFYKQQILINQLNETVENLNNNYKKTFEKNKKLEIIVNKLQSLFKFCKFSDDTDDKSETESEESEEEEIDSDNN